MKRDQNLDATPDATPEATHRAPAAEAVRPTPPAFDVLESAAEFRYLFDLPGVSEGALDLRVEDGRVHLDARQELGEREARLVPPLRFAGSFALPVDADAERVAAELAQGVLTVRVPRLVRSRSIPVRVGQA